MQLAWSDAQRVGLDYRGRMVHGFSTSLGGTSSSCSTPYFANRLFGLCYGKPQGQGASQQLPVSRCKVTAQMQTEDFGGDKFKPIAQISTWNRWVCTETRRVGRAAFANTRLTLNHGFSGDVPNMGSDISGVDDSPALGQALKTIRPVPNAETFQSVALTSFCLWKPICPTSMSAVFFRLVHGVYTTLTLFILQPSGETKGNVSVLCHLKEVAKPSVRVETGSYCCHKHCRRRKQKLE